jgi:hypothetical protein
MQRVLARQSPSNHAAQMLTCKYGQHLLCGRSAFGCLTSCRYTSHALLNCIEIELFEAVTDRSVGGLKMPGNRAVLTCLSRTKTVRRKCSDGKWNVSTTSGPPLKRQDTAAAARAAREEVQSLLQSTVHSSRPPSPLPTVMSKPVKPSSLLGTSRAQGWTRQPHHFPEQQPLQQHQPKWQRHQLQQLQQQPPHSPAASHLQPQQAQLVLVPFQRKSLHWCPALHPSAQHLPILPNPVQQHPALPQHGLQHPPRRI